MSDTVSTVVIGLLVINLLGLLAVGWRISTQSADVRGLTDDIGTQSADVRALTTDNRLLADRLTHLEARVNTMPTHRDLTDLRDDISEVVESVAAISGQTQTMTQMLKSIQDHLLENN
ncbi:DUF2730 family protein [Dyella terrae]|uniref:DUF2730 family protein n=1 Tax=Dyella terrae TaxID=522259 RepID=UPI001EFC5117|nr:DUF2730 family protein [Dyella terrae]ULU26607.1 Cell division coordinator CpoB [Dyella terrae]